MAQMASRAPGVGRSHAILIFPYIGRPTLAKKPDLAEWGRVFSDAGQIWPSWSKTHLPKSGRLADNLVEVGPVWPEFGRSWPNLGKICPKWGRVRCNSAEVIPKSAEIEPLWPLSGKFRPNSTKFGATWTNFGKMSAKCGFGQIWSNSGKYRPNLAELWCFPAQSCRSRRNNPSIA